MFLFRGVKGQKMVQKYKKFSPPCSIYKESYIIWLPFMVHMFKMIISPGVFFNFSKLSFYSLSAAWGIHIYGTHLWCTYMFKRILSPGIFFPFFFLIFSFSGQIYISGIIGHMLSMVHICQLIISPAYFFIFSKFSLSGSIGG